MRRLLSRLEEVCDILDGLIVDRLSLDHLGRLSGIHRSLSEDRSCPCSVVIWHWSSMVCQSQIAHGLLNGWRRLLRVPWPLRLFDQRGALQWLIIHDRTTVLNVDLLLLTLRRVRITEDNFFIALVVLWIRLTFWARLNPKSQAGSLSRRAGAASGRAIRLLAEE